MLSKNHNLKRRLAVFVAVLQLVVAPVTQVLHIGCGCAETIAANRGDGVDEASPFLCCCSCHASTQSDNEEQSREPHDSDSCAVCKAAFGLTTVDFGLPRTFAPGLTSRLTNQASVAVTSTPLYSPPGRGPPCR